MRTPVLLIKLHLVLLVQLTYGGCGGAAPSTGDYDYPKVPPIWIVEDDPKITIFERKDLHKDRKTAQILVIPVYSDFPHDGRIEPLAIAHPLVYSPGEEIEEKLTTLGQRKRLHRLVFWVPGYFPDGMGRTFPWIETINDKKMVVVELQPCIGSERSEIDAAMLKLLKSDFVVEELHPSTPPLPPYTNGPQMTDAPYNFDQLVRSEYCGRFYTNGRSRNNHALWTYPVGTRIANCLSSAEKKTVAQFAERVAKSQSTGAPQE